MARKNSRWRSRVASVSAASTRRFARVLADRLEQSVPVVAAVVVDLDERLVDEARQEIEHGVLDDEFAVARDGLCRLDGEATGEHGESPQHRLLVLVEEVVAPGHRRLERLLARHRGAGAAREQPEAVVEPFGDPPRVHHANPRRRQLDGEREPIDPAADVRDQVELLRVRCEVRAHGRGPLDEEIDRVRGVERRHPPRARSPVSPSGSRLVAIT